MVLVILLVLALFVLQTVLPGRLRVPEAGGPGKLPEDLGNRDQMRPFTVHGQRAVRALANLQEAMPVFLALALMNLFFGPGPMALVGAWIFFAARVLYLPLYVAGVPVVRSVAWAVGVVALLVMAIPLMERV